LRICTKTTKDITHQTMGRSTNGALSLSNSKKPTSANSKKENKGKYSCSRNTVKNSKMQWISRTWEKI